MRLIDANALIEHLTRCIEQSKGLMRSVCVAIKCFVEQLPTIETTPVKHGRWIHDINNLYGCTECGERETMSPKKLKNYCPNCGAKMGSKEG